MTDFDGWCERSGKHYEAAVLERGGTPWTSSVDERRRLWERRHVRPDPPAGLGTPCIRTANREITRRWLATGWVHPSTDIDNRPDGFYEAKPKPNYLEDLTA